MSFFDSLNISATGLTAEQTEMNVTAENLANANSTNNGTPYEPQAVDLESIGSGSTFQDELSTAMGNTSGGVAGPPGGVQVQGIVSENVPAQLVYDPGNPQANKQGYVKEPNIQPVTEMTNMIQESNSYQADVTAMSTSKQMYSSTLELLR
jgi:flagellar basal-body rod protein FlgC